MIEHKEHVPKDVFVEEMKDLQRVDWPSIWEGPPEPTQEKEFREWCERYGWDYQTVETNLIVTTRHGNSLSFDSYGSWSPVESVHFSLWMARTYIPDEKQDVMALARQAWDEYTEKTVSVFGPSSWVGRGDSQDFPDPPREGLWRAPQNPKDNPFRLAYWNPSHPQREEPFIVLKQSHSLRTWEVNKGAGASIKIFFEAPSRKRFSVPPKMRSLID